MRNYTNSFITLIGFFVGIAIMINFAVQIPTIDYGTVKSLIGGLCCSLIFYFFNRILLKVVSKLSLSDERKTNFKKFSALSYLIFFLFFLGAIGVPMTSFNAFLIIILLFLTIQALILSKISIIMFVFPLLFFFSGMAALIYQIVWQRMLFTCFGVNIESVTIIVSIFMLGLGLGALVGGRVSAIFRNKLPHLFIIAELAIGTFGFLSIYLIQSLYAYVSDKHSLLITISVYFLLSIPTLFMGATLPILVSYVTKYIKDIGNSVGILYFCNTAGSAIGCVIVVKFFFLHFGLQTSVNFAASLNFLIALLGAAIIFFYKGMISHEKVR